MTQTELSAEKMMMVITVNMPRQCASTEVISAFSKNVYTTAFDTQITDNFVYVFIVVKTQPPWMKFVHELHLISNIRYLILLLFIRCSYKRCYLSLIFS